MKRLSCILIALVMLLGMTLPAINAVAEGTQAATPAVADACNHILARWEVIDSWYEPDPIGVKCYKYCEELWTFCLLCAETFSYTTKLQLSHDWRVIGPGHLECRRCGQEAWDAK